MYYNLGNYGQYYSSVVEVESDSIGLVILYLSLIQTVLVCSSVKVGPPSMSLVLLKAGPDNIGRRSSLLLQRYNWTQQESISLV